MASITQGGIILFVCTVIFTIFDIFFIFLRFWAAHIIRCRIYPDDYFIVLSFLNTLALEAVLTWAIFFGGMGHYITELTTIELQITLKAIPAAYVTWTLGTAAFKLSVLFLYARIFPTKAFTILCYAMMVLSIAYCVSFLVVFLTTCSPDISQLWNPRTDGHCRDLNIGQVGSVSTNLAIDILIVILPMPFLWNLKMSLRNKIVISLVFSLGLITVGIMIWRIYDLVTKGGGDYVYQMPTLALTTTLELWICIVIACIPTLGPVFKTYVAPLISKLTGSQRSSGVRFNPRSLVTFGRLGDRRRRGVYTTNGSDDLVNADTRAGMSGMLTAPLGSDVFTTQITSCARPDRLELPDENVPRV
ncbi:integral membrane protein [Daldinia decipiens]|uniref:uncharacterized protein n=1 Tax=Daldinia decipiens TaxID=326647 RepID=UPI0020C507CD|nr:uncharacterized protein F4813DRAFT_306931 [Daldinia decipiens]KAI1652572.1 integral membrane protein [Daldinia decipiens]